MYVAEDVRRYNDNGRSELKWRAMKSRESLSFRPYKKRDISSDGTQCHYDEYPWMASRPFSGYSRGEESPGSHCFCEQVDPRSVCLDDDHDVLRCAHCGELMVSDIDEVQLQPCPGEPRAILRWFGALMAAASQSLVVEAGRCFAPSMPRSSSSAMSKRHRDTVRCPRIVRERWWVLPRCDYVVVSCDERN